MSSRLFKYLLGTPFLVVLILGFSIQSAHAKLITVGPSGTYKLPSQAAAHAALGDYIQIDAKGNYAGDTVNWTALNLTIVGVNGRPVIKSNSSTAIWTFPHTAQIYNIELTGCTSGAGIEVVGGGLPMVEVENCYIHDNKNGVLTTGTANAMPYAVQIMNCELNHNGAGDGKSHNINVPFCTSLVVEGSWVHNANGGDEIMSHAILSNIQGNLIGDDATSNGAQEVNLQGNAACLSGNVIVKGPKSVDPSTCVEYDVSKGSLQELYITNNTFSTTNAKSQYFVKIVGQPKPAELQDNLYLGKVVAPLFASKVSVTSSHNLVASASWFVNSAASNFHLAAKSPAIGAGQVQATAKLPPAVNNIVSSFTTAPTYNYIQPAQSQYRAAADHLDVGAFGKSASSVARPLLATPAAPKS